MKKSFIMLMAERIKTPKRLGMNKLPPHEAIRRLETESGIILLDVRSAADYEKKHLPNSLVIPLNNLEKEAPGKLPDHAASIFIYCLTGRRSAQAAKILKRLGYENAVSIGGIKQYSKL